MTKWPIVAALLTVSAVAALVRQSRTAAVQASPATHRIFLPFVAATADPRFALDSGWGAHCCAEWENVLHLAPGLGADQHELIAANDMETFLTVQWFAWFHAAHPNIVLPTHACNYDAVTRTIPQAAECADWIVQHPSHAWMIGNEPNEGYDMGGVYLSPAEYIAMWNIVVPFIRQHDSQARIVSAAWVVDHCGSFYRDNLLGHIDPDIYNIHLYQTATPTNPEIQRQLDCFLADVDGPVWISELGWFGTDPANTTGNVIAFMDSFIPYLETKARVTRWMFWQWGAGATLVQDGVATPAGLEYSKLAR